MSVIKEHAEREGYEVWAHISTAPKDGTEILTVVGRRVEIARWHPAQGKRPAMWRYRRSMSPRFDAANQPEHWRPLPTFTHSLGAAIVCAEGATQEQAPPLPSEAPK